MIGKVRRLLLVVFTALCLPLAGPGQEPIDLFSDAPPLAEGYIRLATWNLRHINVEGQAAASYIPGADYQEDLEILVATFAKAIEDLGLHVVALVEHVPRPDDPLQKIVAALNNGDAGPWRSDETNIEYDEDAHNLRPPDTAPS